MKLDAVYGSAIAEKANLYIRHPLKSQIHLNFYGRCLHSFVGRTYGTNAFGARVPILIYDEGIGGGTAARDTMAQWFENVNMEKAQGWQELAKELEKKNLEKKDLKKNGENKKADVKQTPRAKKEG